MLTISDGVSLFHDARPSSGRGPSNDRLVRGVRWHDLEFWAITSIQDCAVVHDFDVGIDGGQIPPEENGINILKRLGMI